MNFNISVLSDGKESGTIPYRLLKFSGGELHVNCDFSNIGESSITGISYSVVNYTETFIIELSLLVNAVQQVIDKSTVYTTLDMPYVPYGRQDRVCSDGDAFSLKVFAEQINSLNFDKVFVLDPHSDVTGALINNIEVTSVLDICILNSRFIEQYSHLVSPDAGSYKKVNAIGGYYNVNVVPCLKTRDTATGKLSNTKVLRDDVAYAKRMLVIDDICDGGYTFIQLGQELAKAFPNVKRDLYISHGIFSKGTEELKKYYENIYCANLMNPTEGVIVL